MTDSVLLQRVEGGVMELTLNRPERLNSFTEELHLALRAALDTAARDEAVRAVLLTGAGRGFCAGQDLGARNPDTMSGPPDLGETIDTLWNPLVRRLRALPKPVICAVNGVAAGAGANVALACDIVLAAEEARFIQSFANLGLVPDSGGTWTLTRLVGEARAKALMLTGAPVSAPQAAEWGMIWRALPGAELMAEARALARRLAAGPTFGYALTKQAVQAAGTLSLDESLDLERDLQRRAGRSPDYAEGVRAFTQKRSPVFTGRES
ncbi:2-(1,2-epoxy-1,2-dihydrophenyl)acetyl-CoA isomerase [Paroceanicella profunda]|uniref:2-(1,2-epoxy-1,2-dihydrophenyl)acetyl-CoA isomerase n=1 Tax=Paroceanicella profunda TaxID=2579971 RepID=A0A5B8FHA0_9RHOB|nr:2-(1,2-epoxy-1,2-dihydrophenyl)acetyl-CoA isomerase PaaG [Paroceanicella profunda]QDL91937.1 2-(1,2-epoxy-1,2-dihydrophenyl)acetyl-CoA isomerase [Paroceanicella profunda]